MDTSKYQDYLRRKSVEQRATQIPVQPPKPPKARHPDRQKNIITAKQGDTLPDLAASAGVTEKDITDTGVLEVKPGMVIDVTTATARRKAEEDAARYLQSQLDAQQTIITEGQKTVAQYTDRGQKGTPARTDALAAIAAAEAEVERLTAGPAEPEYPEYGGPSRGDFGPSEPVTKPISDFWRWLNVGHLSEEEQIEKGFTDQYMAGYSPEEIAQGDFDFFEAQRDYETGQFIDQFGGGKPLSGVPETMTGAQRAAALEEGIGTAYGEAPRGQAFETPNGGKFFASIDKESWTQETADALSATKKYDQLINAVNDGDWEMMPDFISNAQSQHIFGPNSDITYEDMSALGYSLDDYGNWVHEDVDTEVAFNPGYGDYYGGYGGYGGGGGGYEPNKNTYAGGRAEQTSGAFAKRAAERAQAGSLGSSNWRI